jgi:EmrB/QacA subfamily drug resistance transporter
MSSTEDAGLLTPRTRASAGTVLAVASGAAFLSMLDTTIANLAVSDLHVDFPAVALGDLSWVITIYAVAFAALLAPGGRVADLVGRRALLAVGVALFTIMSLACAVAPSVGVLLVARGLQGVGAAAMIPASLAVVLADTPPERRAAAIGVWSAASAGAAAAGPALGGVLVDVAGWRSVFLINVPLGLALLAATSLLPIAGRRGGRAPDAVGTALLGAGVGLAALGVSQGAAWGWGSAATLAALAGGVVASGAALARSMRHPAPAIETTLWRSRTFAVANIGSLLYGATLFPWMLTGVLFLTQVWDYSPLRAGFAVTPGAVTASLVALRAGPLVARVGPRPVVVGGAAVMGAVALWLVLALGEAPDFLGLWLPTGAIAGMGMGAVTTGLSSAAALSVAPPRFAAAVGLNQTARVVGGALGVAALATILRASDPGAVGGYAGVLGMAAGLSALTAVAGIGLVHRPAVRGAA